MSWILVTNDDGVDSPALVPLANALAAVAPVEVVVPDRERSWVAKAITRFDPVRVETVERDGLTVRTTTGYPADCVQLGVHTLFGSAPRLVVSGINIGYNHGSAYMQSSGTVGAALEAAIAGSVGVAFSAGSMTTPWGEWRAWALSSASRPMWERLASLASDLVAPLFEAAPPGAVVSVNLPDRADVKTERRITRVAAVGYDRLFREASPGVFVHDFGGAFRNDASLVGTDVQAADDQVVAITPLLGPQAATLSAEMTAALGCVDLG